jgi:hypothetical protein
MNTYSDQRTDVSVFKVCNLCGDHAIGDLDTIISGIHSCCDGINSGGCISVVFEMLTSIVKLLAAFVSAIAAASAVRSLLAVMPMVAMVASMASSVAYAVAAMVSSAVATVSAIVSLGAAVVATMALPAGAAVAAMAFLAPATFVVFATSTSIVGLPAAFAPPMAAASTKRAPAVMPPLISTSVHPS